MKQIQCTRGVIALVDDGDFECVAKHSWTGSDRYPRAKVRGKVVSMHRFILGEQSGMVIDHINGNRFDNRRSNLRFCTRAQNAANTKRRATTKVSPFRGVYPQGSQWVAMIGRTRLGVFADATDAARTYDKTAISRYGAFARLNFPVAPQTSFLPT